ncbi:MAG TPA: PQQ-binding-like beta-propeller repeat protein, partial [Rhodanobacteraceae bacterium]|nr:PQQ-binding-like beta-propeller repeat protein [Rhodanobacteraceae bacterium]
MHSRRARRQLTTACLAQAFLFLGTAATAGTVWSNLWTVAEPPTLHAYLPTFDAWPSPPAAGLPSTAAAFATNGDVVFGAGTATPTEYQFVRMAPDGSVRWSANVDWYDGATYAGAEALIATDDGGALIAVGNGYYDDGDHVIRIGADGSALWSRDVPTGWLADVGAGRIASASGTTLTVMDATTGDVLWQRRLNQDIGAEPAGGVAADAAGNLYATFPIGAPALGTPASAFRVIRFDANGDAAWNVETPVADGASIVGVGDAYLFVRTALDVRALRLANGSVAWTQPISPTARVLVAGSPAEALVVESDAIRRLAADNGDVRWTTPLTGATRLASTVANAVLVNTSAGVAKVDVDSGAIAWTHALPAGDAAFWATLGGTPDDVFAIGRAPYGTFAAPPAIRRIDFASGAVSDAIAVAPVEQGVVAQSAVDAAGDVVAASAGVENIRVRSVDGSTGATQWDIVDALDGMPPVSVGSPGIGAGGDAIAVATALNAGDLSGGPGFLRVTLLERASGDVRWTVDLHDDDQLFTEGSTPAIDADGNVIVGAGAGVVCPFGTGDGCERRTVYKLAAADGAVLWRFDQSDQVFIALQVFPQTFTLIGPNVATALSEAQDTPVTYLSGADGSTLWTSDAFGTGFAFYPASDGNLLVRGYTGWGKLDVATGATLMTGDAAPSMCQQRCYDYETFFAANDDIVTVGEGDWAPLLWRLEGSSGLAETWVPEAPVAGMRSLFNSVYGVDGAGHVALRLLRAHRGVPDSIAFLATFDLSTGTLGPQQAIHGGDDDVLAAASFESVRAAAPDRLLVSTIAVRPPSATTNGQMLLDTTVTAHGDLTAAVSADTATASPGALLGFHVTATYAGDQPVSGATLAALLPWRSGVSDLACATTSASNCVL